MNGAFPPHRLSRRAKWELILGISGFVYVILTFWLNLDSPIISILLIGLVGYDLLTVRMNRPGSSRPANSGRRGGPPGMDAKADEIQCRAPLEDRTLSRAAPTART